MSVHSNRDRVVGLESPPSPTQGPHLSFLPSRGDFFEGAVGLRPALGSLQGKAQKEFGRCSQLPAPPCHQVLPSPISKVLHSPPRVPSNQREVGRYLSGLGSEGWPFVGAAWELDLLGFLQTERVGWLSKQPQNSPHFGTRKGKSWFCGTAPCTEPHTSPCASLCASRSGSWGALLAGSSPLHWDWGHPTSSLSPSSPSPHLRPSPSLGGQRTLGMEWGSQAQHTPNLTPVWDVGLGAPRPHYGHFGGAFCPSHPAVSSSS